MDGVAADEVVAPEDAEAAGETLGVESALELGVGVATADVDAGDDALEELVAQ